MRYPWLLLAPLLLTQTGCDTTFPNEEMDVAGEPKTRPFAVVCNPPEAAPGETVTVSMYYYEPDPDRHDVSWRVALDYDLGLYEADEVERDYIDLDAQVAPPIHDEHGFCIQAFTYTIPDDALLRASSQPEVITDELVLALARPLLSLAEDEPLTKAELDLHLAMTADGNVSWWYIVDEQTRLAWGRLADLFACEIRFRASIDGSVRVDVTKNLTVRYSPRLESVNVNENIIVESTRIQAVPHPDIAYDDIDDYADEIQVYWLSTSGWPGELQEIPLHDDWTYYLKAEFTIQEYTSPFDDSFRWEEVFGHWYYYDLDHPGSGHPLFIQDDGGEAEMSDLDNSVRLSPPARAGQLGYRIATCLRDERLEWRGYAYTPGVDLVYSEFVFVDP